MPHRYPMKPDGGVCVNGTYASDLPSYEWRPPFFVCIFVIVALYTAATVAAMVYRRAYNPVQARSLPLVLFSAVGSVILGILRTTEEVTTPPEFPCDAGFFTSVLFPTCVVPPLMLRLFRLWHLTRFNERMKLVKHGDRSATQEMRQMQRLTGDTSLLVVAVLTTLPYVGVAIYLFISDDRLGHGCTNCEISDDGMLASVILSIFFICMCLLGLWLTRSLNDSLSLRKEIVHGTIMWGGVVFASTLFQVVPPLRELQDEGLVTPGVWFLLGAVCHHTLLVTLPALGTWNIGPYKSHARRYGFLPKPGSGSGGAGGGHGAERHAAVSAGGGDETASSPTARRSLPLESWELVDILNDTRCADVFTEHLASEFSVENIKFWLHTREFKTAGLRELDPTRTDPMAATRRRHMTLRAQWIVDTYLEPSAPLMVNVSSQNLDTVQATITKGGITPELFDDCRREIYLLMERDAFPRFRRSARFADLKRERQNGGRGSARRNNNNNTSSTPACCSCACLSSSRRHRASLGDQELTSV